MEAERERKFNEFLRLSQEGILGSTEIADKIGISINTLYNWRKRLRTDTHPLQQQKPVPQFSLPSFSRVILEQKNNKAASPFIEINVGNSAVIRIPEQFWMFYKRLEQGTFEIPSSNSNIPRIGINAEQLHLMLCGIDLSSVRKRKRFEFQQMCQE